jgi:Ethanolamine utilization protein EutJ (predicted chaperonin)
MSWGANGSFRSHVFQFEDVENAEDRNSKIDSEISRAKNPVMRCPKKVASQRIEKSRKEALFMVPGSHTTVELLEGLRTDNP